MKDSTVAEARSYLDTAIQRLMLNEVEEHDVEKALENIENAKNILNQ